MICAVFCIIKEFREQYNRINFEFFVDFIPEICYTVDNNLKEV